MRNGNILVLVERKELELLEVSIYDKADIEQHTWQFFDKDDAEKKFNEVKKADQGPIDETGAKR